MENPAQRPAVDNKIRVLTFVMIQKSAHFADKQLEQES